MDDSDGRILELPASLVEETLASSESVGEGILSAIASVLERKAEIRDWLNSNDMIGTDGEMEDVDTPTTCGVDGSYVLEHMLSASIVACAAVAAEGFAPPSERKHWPLKYETFVETEVHSPELGSVVRGLMKVMESNLAATAPHDVVLSDGSVTSNIIHMNHAVSAAKGEGEPTKIVGKTLLQRYPGFLRKFRTMLDSEGDRVWASLPKYTTRSEIGGRYNENNGWPQQQDDRSVMTAVLKPGEYTKPLPLTNENDSWHLPRTDDPNVPRLVDMCLRSMENQMVFYYKPHYSAPALRVETGSWVKHDARRFAILLRSLKFQYPSYTIMEPYPLYMADRMVKSLGSMIPILKQSAMQKIVSDMPAGTKDVLFGMRGYRTES